MRFCSISNYVTMQNALLWNKIGSITELIKMNPISFYLHWISTEWHKITNNVTVYDELNNIKIDVPLAK